MKNKFIFDVYNYYNSKRFNVGFSLCIEKYPDNIKMIYITMDLGLLGVRIGYRF